VQLAYQPTEMASGYATNLDPGFNFRHFIDRWFPARSTYSSDPIPQLPDDVHPATRRQIEAIVASIDSVSVRGLLLRATIDHERHVGKLVSLHCETYSGTSGRLWASGDETHKFAGDVRKSIDSLDILTVERLLVDASLTFRNVATRIAAEFRWCSKEMYDALADIQQDYSRCRYFIRVLSEDWQEYTEGYRSQSGRTSLSISPESAAADLASTLARLLATMCRVPRWETCRNTLLAFQEIMGAMMNELPKCEESFWGNLLTPLMLQASKLMTHEERKRYVHEGFYYGLLQLCPYLPTDEANALYLQFPVGHAMVERSRAEELAKAMRTTELRWRRPNIIAPERARPYELRPSQITKASKARRPYFSSGAYIKVE
jgi:hypothetical protein